jgi:hypothetical protein
VLSRLDAVGLHRRALSIGLRNEKQAVRIIGRLFYVNVAA